MTAAIAMTTPASPTVAAMMALCLALAAVPPPVQARPASGAIEVPAPGRGGDSFVVLYSGDGGWAHGDRAISRALAASGLPVVGVDSLHYFWKARSDEGAAEDLARLITEYAQRWRRPRVILMGYSFGASALALIAAPLPPDVRRRVRLVALVAPTDYAELVLRPQSWFGRPDRTARPLQPALAKLRGLPILCVFGAADRNAACPRLDTDIAMERELPGDHHFGGHYDQVSAVIAAMATP